MKIARLLLVFWMLGSGLTMAQSDEVNSQIYRWNELKVDKTAFGESRSILKGATTALASLEIHAMTLLPDKSIPSDKVPEDTEELVIIKTGELAVNVDDRHKVIGPGSVVLFLPGEKRTLKNTSDSIVTYYVFNYTSKAPVDMERGKKAGGSRIVDWEEVELQETDTGGRRQMFDRPTAMLSRFEMHVTTLNADLASHPPHTHPAEEFVLMRKGEVDMLIGDTHYKATEGDLLFMASQLSHGLNNEGKGQTEYFAFQWQ